MRELLEQFQFAAIHHIINDIKSLLSAQGLKQLKTG